MAGIATTATFSFIFLRRPALVLRKSSQLVSSQDFEKLDTFGDETAENSDQIVADISKSDNAGWKQDVYEVINLLKSKRFLPCIPEIAWTGISIAIYTGLLVPIISESIIFDGTETADEKSKKEFELSMLAMVSLGVGEIVGSISMGLVVDHFGAKRSSFLNMFFIGSAAMLVVIYIYIDTFSWMAFLMTFLWGVQDSGISIHLDAILGFEFASNKTPFACDVLIESIVACSFEIGSSFVKGNTARLIYIMVMGIIGVLFAFAPFFFEYLPPLTHKHEFGKITDSEKEKLNESLDPNEYLINN
jgi:hypothetical protein